MKLYFISDNSDTAMGLRLAGIEGVIVTDEVSTLAAFDMIKNCSDICIVFITPKVYAFCPDFITTFKINNDFPPIVEIPDRRENTTIMFDDIIKELTGIII